MLKLNFKKSTLGLTEEEFKKKSEEMSVGKFFQPGTYNLRIKDAELAMDKNGNCMSSKDPTWAKIKITFADTQEREMMHWLLVPTSKLLYNEKESKRPEYIYFMFREFCAGLGIDTVANEESTKAVVSRYFKDPKALIGKEVEVDIGYQGPYIKYISKEQFQICNKMGEPIIEEIFTTRELALAAAVGLNLKLEGFTRIIKFHGKEIVNEEETTEDKDW